MAAGTPAAPWAHAAMVKPVEELDALRAAHDRLARALHDERQAAAEARARVVQLLDNLAGYRQLLDVGGEKEEALRRSEARFRALIEGLGVPVGVHRDGFVVWANHAHARYFGFERPADVMGTPVEHLLHPDDHARSRQRDAEMLASGAPAPVVELRLRRRDGAALTAEVSAQPILFDGAPAILAAAHDTTERRAMEKRLAEAERLAAVGTLAAGVAHEINNPLAAVVANLDVSLADLPMILPSCDSATRARLRELAEALSDAREGAERVRLIVRSLKTFASAEQAPRTAVDVGAAVEAALRRQGDEIRRRARLTVAAEPLPQVMASGGRLEELFGHLLANAALAIAEGRPDENEVRVTVRRVGALAEVEIRDSGCGMDERVLRRAREPFFTTRGIGATGLGLSLAHGIARALDGELLVESAPGQGTAVRVRLPFAAA